MKLKRKVFFVFGFSIITFSACSAQSAVEAPFHGQWYIQAEGGVGFPVSGLETALYDPGTSGEIQAGYQFTKDFALGLEGRQDFLPWDRQQVILWVEQQYGVTGVTGTTTIGITHRSLDLVGRYYPPFFKPFQLYLFCGAGVAFDYLGGNYNGSWNGYTVKGSWPPGNWTNFELVPGLGVAFPLSNQLNIFAEGKVVVDYSPTSGSNPESEESPIVGIPIQAGLEYTIP